jgi:hypothetical protein
MKFSVRWKLLALSLSIVACDSARGHQSRLKHDINE